MKKVFDLFKRWFNLDQTKKLKEADTPVVDENKEIKIQGRIGGGKVTKTRFNRVRFAKKTKNRIQGRSRNINHKKAA